MAKFHVNDKGEPGECRAKIQCRFGGATGVENHYPSMEEARWAAEDILKEEMGGLTPKAGPLQAAFEAEMSGGKTQAEVDNPNVSVLEAEGFTTDVPLAEKAARFTEDDVVYDTTDLSNRQIRDLVIEAAVPGVQSDDPSVRQEAFDTLIRNVYNSLDENYMTADRDSYGGNDFPLPQPDGKIRVFTKSDMEELAKDSDLVEGTVFNDWIVSRLPSAFDDNEISPWEGMTKIDRDYARETTFKSGVESAYHYAAQYARDHGIELKKPIEVGALVDGKAAPAKAVFDGVETTVDSSGNSFAVIPEGMSAEEENRIAFESAAPGLQSDDPQLRQKALDALVEHMRDAEKSLDRRAWSSEASPAEPAQSEMNRVSRVMPLTSAEYIQESDSNPESWAFGKLPSLLTPHWDLLDNYPIAFDSDEEERQMNEVYEASALKLSRAWGALSYYAYSNQLDFTPQG